MRKFSRKNHKKIFIYLGVVMLLWIVTGVIMSLTHGRDWVELTTNINNKNVDYSNISLSPADAINNIQLHSDAEKIANIQLVIISGTIMYIARDAKHKKHLINAKTGDYYTYSLKDAVLAVPQAYQLEGEIIDSSIVNRHSLDYIWGDLPMYRLVFGDSSHVYYVDPIMARALKTSFFTKIRNVAGVLHTFEPIRKITGSERLRQLMMIGLGLIALFGTVLGIYLTFPIRKK